MQSLDESGHVQVLDDVDLPLPGRSVGKVRVSYRLPDGRLLFVTTDRLSAFDRVVAVVPHKGQVLNELAWWWFANTKDIVANHALSKPHPNALVAREARPLPVEVVVRGHITGVTSTSLWKQYEAGARVIYGHKLPQDLRKNARLPEAIITPTTKAEAGQHDSPLTCAEVVDRGLVAPALWEEVKRTALALFSRGQEVARDAGLVLADTKYEFGLSPDNELMLIDEVHTPDSSRFWEARSLVDRYMAGLEPVSMDKEIIRRALAEAGYTGDGPVPTLSAEVLGETSRRYIETYEKVTGTTFVPATEPVADRLRADLGDIAGWGA